MPQEPNRGDIVAIQGQLCFLDKINESTNTALIINQNGDIASVGVEQLSVVDRPLNEWPFLMLPNKPGKLITIQHRNRNLLWLEDWVKFEGGLISGPVYLSPDLGLGLGDMLMLHNNRGQRFRVDVGRSFKSMRDKRRIARKRGARCAPPPKRPVEFDLFSHVLDDDDDDA